MGPSVESNNRVVDQKLVSNPDENVLKKHVAFFARNNGWHSVSMGDVSRAIGAGIALSALGAVLINAAVSAKTRPGEKFSASFPIVVENINFAKHGSDSGVYDSDGRFVPSKFEEIVAKHAHENPDFLTSDELQELLKANREPKDFLGWVAAWTEWKALYLLDKDPNGLLRKETVRGVYDGRLFVQLEKANASKKKA